MAINYKGLQRVANWVTQVTQNLELLTSLLYLYMTYPTGLDKPEVCLLLLYLFSLYLSMLTFEEASSRLESGEEWSRLGCTSEAEDVYNQIIRDGEEVLSKTTSSVNVGQNW